MSLGLSWAVEKLISGLASAVSDVAGQIPLEEAAKMLLCHCCGSEPGLLELYWEAQIN